jgi:hypothetical protein
MTQWPSRPRDAIERHSGLNSLQPGILGPLELEPVVCGRLDHGSARKDLAETGPTGADQLARN